MRQAKRLSGGSVRYFGSFSAAERVHGLAHRPCRSTRARGRGIWVHHSRGQVASWYTVCMTTQVPVRLTDSDLASLDAAIARGRFANRSEALRAGLERVLAEEREQQIDEAYAAGYGKHPQEEWVAELGFAALVAFDKAEGGAAL